MKKENNISIIDRLKDLQIHNNILSYIIQKRLLEELDKVKNSEEFINKSYLPEDRK